ncbi:uncharacterized protein METZ01_LOCUS441785 [marine metagenome]|uniref:Uncharacterized protein n=1 Tax=marine metagenome TaxID=408172 RepID=A0A382Z0I0_9ZZZZ|tara:strand:- start:88 stop:522 length:435 start_codon:yes stop_codon:yes gene_type:complete
MAKATDLDDNTRFAMPVRNLISLVIAVALGVWAYFGVIERLNKIETQAILVQSDLTKNTEFRIKWPRGDLGTTPADSEQFMLIEHLAGQLENLSSNIETGKAPFDQQQALTLEFYEKRISALETRLELVRDAIASLKANGGNNQ